MQKVSGLASRILVRLEFEIKLEPLLLPSTTAAATATTAATAATTTAAAGPRPTGLVIASLCWVAAPELAELLARAGQDTSSVFIPAGDM